jgi:hypothetical protein
LRLTSYLWTKTGEPPIEWTEYFLCRYVYHCTPNELDRVEYRRTQDHLLCADVEARVAQEERKLK